LVLNYLDAIRPRGSQGKENGVIRVDTLTSTQVKMMRVKMYPIHVQLVKVVAKAVVAEAEAEALEIRDSVDINF
jgi:hypothetical protein